MTPRMSRLATLLLTSISLFSAYTYADHTITAYNNIEWAKPKGFSLTADIYVPDTNKKSYPVLVIYHGGGWLINRNSIMNNMAQYVASHSDMIVVNMNYRLLGDLNNTTTLNEIVEDAIGGTLWVKDHIQQYHGNPNAIAVTGDSAGGQLAAMVVLAGRKLNSQGFAGKNLGFTPTYLPPQRTAEQVAQHNGAQVQAAVLSYAAFDLYNEAKTGFENDSNILWKMGKTTPRGIFGAGITVEKRPDFYKAVSPIYLVPSRKEHPLPPQFVLVGSEDNVTPASMANHYVELLKAAHQPVEYKVYQGRTHAFLDSGCSNYTHGCFKDLAPAALNDMIDFLNRTLKK